ncbi:hypothetical protein ACJX0J_015256, partial [Zea mays]
GKPAIIYINITPELLLNMILCSHLKYILRNKAILFTISQQEMILQASHTFRFLQWARLGAVT